MAPPFGPDAPWKTNDQFMSSLATERAQREFADELMLGSLPPDNRIKIEIKRVGLSDVGGLRVLMVASEITIGATVMLDTSMIAVHKSRIMRCAVHFSAGVLNPDTRKAIDAFMDGLQFEK